jgi:hypothetical protein
MTKRSAPWSHSNDTFASLIIPHLENSNTPSCPPLVWVPIPPNLVLEEEGNRIGLEREENDRNHVTSGIVEPVLRRPQNVSSRTAAIGKGAVGHAKSLIAHESVNREMDLNKSLVESPRYRRKNIWNNRSHPQSPTAIWTESALPLPRPSEREFQNLAALRTISKNPGLFFISTCINIDKFESLLVDHPNPQFVKSVCQGLREGFWPFADTHFGEWPLSFDNSFRPLKSEAEAKFVKSQIDKEVKLGRYSEAFGPDLLPGMYSMPVHAVPKPGTNKFRLVTDHSAGPYALNSMISWGDIAGVALDNVQHLGNGLRHFHWTHWGKNLQLWKADVSEAYRHMPMHLLWQVKQIVSFSDKRYVDRQNIFGSRASQRIYHAFMALVIWIAIVKIFMYYLYIYVDDSFLFEHRDEMELYSPYRKVLPHNLCKLLWLWDRLGIPHEERKQVFGQELPIIGFDVDPNVMRV